MFWFPYVAQLHTKNMSIYCRTKKNIPQQSKTIIINDITDIDVNIDLLKTKSQPPCKSQPVKTFLQVIFCQERKSTLRAFGGWSPVEDFNLQSFHYSVYDYIYLINRKTT